MDFGSCPDDLSLNRPNGFERDDREAVFGDPRGRGPAQNDTPGPARSRRVTTILWTL